jgi:hypothetical protein
MMDTFTDLEHAVLKAICGHNSAVGDQLNALLSTARSVERENTGHGFYTAFQVDGGLAPLTLPDRLLNGPDADVQIGRDILMMGFILWFSEGYPACLEGFGYATKAGDIVDLREHDLSAMRLIREDWSGACTVH